MGKIPAKGRANHHRNNREIADHLIQNRCREINPALGGPCSTPGQRPIGIKHC